MIKDVTNDSRNYLGKDPYGKHRFAKTKSDGTQLYGYSQNGVVKGVGVHIEPIDIFTNKGLSK